MKKSTSRQSTWSFKSTVLRYSSPISSSGRSIFYCYKRHQRSRLSRRCTYPLTHSTASTSMRLYATRHLARQKSPPPSNIFSTIFGRAATISSATASTTHYSLPTTHSFIGLVSYHDTHPPVFHAQSLLFLFGFLFFPCWWIGAFCHYEEKPAKDRPQTVMPVHPSLLANGRIASRILWMPQHDEEKQEKRKSLFEQERAMYRLWNKYMSFASLALVALVVAMLVWYHIGVRRAWWKAIV
ncbi:hypothetical protein BJV82DRAFT_56653 [Fennellomyces sp. T-0311]|nr:hypothetical protein BJV82DRAFT_56653 [Fennellomyces sp. T-0311]